MPRDYIKTETTPFYTYTTGATPKREQVAELLWGDGVERLSGPLRDGLCEVRARGRRGWVTPQALGGEPLLEFYFIDVGQGDGVLVKTPDGKHLLVDGGYLRSRQPTGRNAADFVDWKFARDYGARKIALDALIASHCDADHYGGLWDLLDAEDVQDERELDEVKIGKFYHAGVGWWKNATGKRSLGRKVDGKLVTLVGSGPDMDAALRGISGFKPQGEWGQFLEQVQKQGCPVQRLSHLDAWLPGFAPGDPSKTKVRVLGPIETTAGGQPARESLGSDSQNTNGHSILLRFDYGNSRVLLTGDLNAGSQKLLMEHYRSQPGELECDVAKACHHGSDDCSLTFLQMLKAGATVISSGDNEAHAHPRPSIVAASALTGHLTVEEDRVKTPLIYSTEISRTVRVGRPVGLADGAGGALRAIGKQETFQPEVSYLETSAGDLKPRPGRRKLSSLHVIPGVIYGLVNVRTDGKTILCATMNEKSATFDVKSFAARF